jgi:3-oxoadipate enol-lactonase
MDANTMTFNTSDGCEISYTVRAASTAGAPRVAFIHSLALDRRIWNGVADRLADRATILTYDCRGHGQSERRSGAYTPELFARDLAELLDQVGWKSAVVAGCSMGGNVAQAFAGQYPVRVDALGLIDTTAWYGADAPKTWRDRAETARSKGLCTLIDFQLTRWFSDQYPVSHPEVVNALKKVFLATDLNCYASSCMMLGELDLRHYLPSLSMPVAVIVGEQDYATPVAAARQLQETIRGSSLTIIPGARHLTPVECPDQIASHLLDLIVRLKADATGHEPGRASVRR